MQKKEVEAIEPEIMHLYLGDTFVPPYYSFHLLRDGILMYTYEKQDVEFIVSDIYFSEDFMLNSLRNVFSGERMDFCYAIDPLDYVVNSSLTE